MGISWSQEREGTMRRCSRDGKQGDLGKTDYGKAHL